ncbi:MAG: SpoIIE family protein phosphatase [Cytophagales bacterium]
MRLPFRLTIGRKIGLGFGILIFFTLINFIVTFFTLHKSRQLSDDIINIYTPSVDGLEEYNVMMLNASLLINNWVLIQSGEDNYDKIQLKKLLSQEYPRIRKKIEDTLSINWNENEKQTIKKIFKKNDVLFSMYKDIMSQLNSFSAYEDATILFPIKPMIAEDGEITELTRDILSSLDLLISKQHKITQSVSKQMIGSFNIVQSFVSISGILLIIGGVIVAIATIRTIVKPVTELKDMLLQMGKGIIPDKNVVADDDEIGEMTLAMSQLVGGLKSTAQFSKEVGSGNFESEYKPLSENDILGNSLLVMRKDLKELTSNLEQKVKERTEQIEAQKVEIEEKNEKLRSLYEAVTDSIKYASRIQQSFLPTDIIIKRSLPEYFVLYKPKDIVSGDFYWFEKKKDAIYLAAVDCTGHGVPGALMSIIGNFILDYNVSTVESISPGEVLDGLNEGVTNTLKIGQADSVGSKDGMDITLCKIDYKNQDLQFAGAFNPLYMIRDGEFSEFKTDKFPIGHYAEEPERKYLTQHINYKKGDVFYIFTDGYADQFGGPNGKKFMYKRFRELLIEIHQMPMNEQRDRLDQAIESWRGEEEQIDDILVIGFKL